MTVNEWLPNPGTGNPVREGETLTAYRMRSGCECAGPDVDRYPLVWSHGKDLPRCDEITHYQVSPFRVTEPATMSADEVLIRAREAYIEVNNWTGGTATEMRSGDDDHFANIRAILIYERDRAKPLAEVAPHTAEDPDERAAYDLYVEQFGRDPFSLENRHGSSHYRSILKAIKRGRELERGE